MPTNKKKKRNKKENAPPSSSTTIPLVLDKIMEELASVPAASSERTCYHGSTAEKFALDSEFGKVICDYLSSQRQKLDNGCSTREKVDLEEKFGMEHVEFMTDPRFGRFIFAFSTTVYLNSNLKENLLAKITVVRRLLQLGMIIKYAHIPKSLGGRFNAEIFLKHSMDVNADERGVINCLSRETKIFCDCMKPKKTEAKDMEKLGRCYGCNEIFQKEQLRLCTGCSTIKFCSKECHRRKWNDHKVQCKLIREI
jgi:hypothetical protein